MDRREERENISQARGRLLDHAHECFVDYQSELELQSRQLVDAMERSMERGVVEYLFSKWKKGYNEFLDAEYELRRLMPDRELLAHDDNLASVAQSCRDIVDRATLYLSTTTARSSASVRFAEASRETERLGAELRRLGSQLTTASSPGPGFSSEFDMGAYEPRGTTSLPTTMSMRRPVLGSAEYMNVNNNHGHGDAYGEPSYGAGDAGGVPPVNPRAHVQPPTYGGVRHEPYPSPVTTGGAARGPVSVVGSSAAPSYPPRDPLLDPGGLVVNRLFDMLESGAGYLPRLQPDVFDRDILKFPGWWRSFVMTVESRPIPDRIKLQYLGQYTKGDALKIVSLYLPLDSDQAYHDAKQALFSRYGDKMKISDEYRSRLDRWPPVKKGDVEGLLKFSDFLKQILSAMATIDYLSTLDSREENRKMTRKLPYQIAERWDRHVYKIRRGERRETLFQERDMTGPYPTFAEFCAFVDDEARMAADTCIQRSTQAERPSKKESEAGSSRRHTVMQTETTVKRPRSQPTLHTQEKSRGPPPAGQRTQGNRAKEDKKCLVCEADHRTEKCDKFKAMNYDDRKDLVRAKNACFGCLVRGHRWLDCRNKLPNLFRDPPSTEEKLPVYVANHVRSGPDATLASWMVMVRVYHRDFPHLFEIVCALLDTQADCCFISQDLGERLQGPWRSAKLDLRTLGNRCQISTRVHEGIVVEPLMFQGELNLPQCFSREAIPGNMDALPLKEQLEKWPHLRGVLEEFPDLPRPDEPGLLLGYNVPEAFAARAPSVCGEVGEPFGTSTMLGWVFMGDMSGDVKIPRAMCFKTSGKEIAVHSISQAFDLDFQGPTNSKKKVSMNDLKFLEIMRHGLKRNEEGRVIMPLPFRVEPSRVPDSRPIALKRLMSLRMKLLRKPEFRCKYVKFMNDLFVNRHAEKIPPSQLNRKPKWYLAHQGVEHAEKPDVVRVVYDPTIEVEGWCLNAQLLSGPDLMNNLTGVLLRFRRERVPVGCDIRGMFHQFLLDQFDRDFGRFLWFEGGDVNGEVIDCRMTVHLFGLTSSPGCANYAMKYLAELYRGKYGDEVADFIRDEFYVDDGYTSVAEVDTAEKLIKGSRSLCAEAGIDLHKFTTSDPELLERIPPELRAADLQSPVQSLDNLPPKKTLGTGWDKSKDVLVYLLRLIKAQPTRRSMLSVLSSIFDPMGLIGPAILPGRRILQRLVQEQVMWDEPVRDELWTAWQDWEKNMEMISSLEIQRCLRRTANHPLSSVELHTFVDASMEGYGSASYLVLRSPGAVDRNLVFAKSKVPPSKAVTIPRRELQAAVLGVTNALFLVEELRYPGIVLYFYTDSTVVLGYIANDSRRFHLYVSNRVQQIRDSSEVKQWRHVGTDENPADIASRGCSVEDLLDSSLWWHGPDFLERPVEEEIDETEYQEYLGDDDPELKTVTALSTEACLDGSEDEPLPLFANPGQIGEPACVQVNIATAEEQPPAKPHRDFVNPLEAISKLSSWQSMVSTIAVWRRFFHNRRAKNLPLTLIPRSGPLTVTERQEATLAVVRLVQRDAYPDEMKRLLPVGLDDDVVPARRFRVRKSSTLYKLDVFMSRDNCLRVAGRIKNAELPRDVTQPWVMPRGHPVVTALIHHHHASSGHVSARDTAKGLREAGFWICQVKSAVNTVVSKCVRCKRHRGKPEEQKMAELPPERVSEAPPFTYVGADYFGPILLKSGRHGARKRWVLLFTCLAVRAVHLELMEDMTTDSFLLAVRRLANRRGPIRALYTDQGKSFIGAEAELRDNLAKMKWDTIKEKLARKNCDLMSFNFIPPKAPHMGGAWERQVQSSKRILYRLVNEYGDRMTDAEMATLLTEIEAIMNSRPMTCLDSLHAESLLPLTPAQLLTMKTQAVAPLPGRFVKQDLYGRVRWRRVQHLANLFWDQWRTDYLPTLQKREKWQERREEVRVGDVVVLVDPDLPRNRWKMARIVEVLPSKDGLVRKVKLQTGDSTYERPITQLVVIYSPNAPLEDTDEG